jgi:hypothetical protein
LGKEVEDWYEGKIGVLGSGEMENSLVLAILLEPEVMSCGE